MIVPHVISSYTGTPLGFCCLVTWDGMKGIPAWAQGGRARGESEVHVCVCVPHVCACATVSVRLSTAPHPGPCVGPRSREVTKGGSVLPVGSVPSVQVQSDQGQSQVRTQASGGTSAFCSSWEGHLYQSLTLILGPFPHLYNGSPQTTCCGSEC